MPCACAWRVVDTRAYTAALIRHLLGHQRQAGHPVPAPPAPPPLISLNPTAPRLPAPGRPAADRPPPGPGPPALPANQQPTGEQKPPTATAGATRSSPAAAA